MRRSRPIDVRRALALAALFHFLLSAARACLLPFLTLHLRRLGLGPALVGVVMGSKHLVTAAWSPASSLLAGLCERRRAAVGGALALAALLPLLLLLLPPLTSDPSDQAAGCHPAINGSGAPPPHTGHVTAAGPAAAASGTTVRWASAAGTGAGAGPTSGPPAGPAKPTLKNSSAPPPPPPPPPAAAAAARVRRSPTQSASADPRGGATGEEEAEGGTGLGFLSSLKTMDPQQQLFFLVLITVTLWEVASASVDWTADDGLHEYLDWADASDRYRGGGGGGGWSLLGAACGAGGAGLLLSQLTCLLPGPAARGAVHFYLYAAVAAAAVPVAARLPLQRAGGGRRRAGAGLGRALRLLRGSPRALLCALSGLLVGAAASAVHDFLLWRLRERGGGPLHMGLALALALLSQAAFPLLEGRVAARLGPARALALGVAALALQCLCYALLGGPWGALPAQPLSCLSAGAFGWAVRVQCEDAAPPGAERSARRLCGALPLQLGGALGSFGGGLLVQRLGLTWLFGGAAGALALWGAALPLLHWRAPQQRRIDYSRLLAADGSEASDSDSEPEDDWLDEALQLDPRGGGGGNR